MKLPETQVAVLEAASADDPTPVEQIAEETGEQVQAVAGAAFELEAQGLLAVTERTDAELVLTEEGDDYAYDGLPEHSLWVGGLSNDAVDEPIELGQAIGRGGLEDEQVEIALSNFARKGMGTIDSGSIQVDPDFDLEADAERTLLEVLRGEEGEIAPDEADEEAVASLERRGLVEREESTVREVTLTDEGVTAMMEGIEVAETVGQITPELLTSGEWEAVEFAEYNVQADAETVHGGKPHALREMSERVTDVLVGMGFEEMQGPHVDADFYINDCLFMPQDHPARNHWDRFALEEPAAIDREHLPPDLVDRVEAAHRDGVGPDGEGYHSPWDEDFARALALRGHTTNLSVRHLAGLAEGDLEPPQRYFSIEKAYRNDTLDSTHLLEFFQIEGWVMAEDLSVRDLMGTFTEFYEQFGITDIQFKPHYNPYTEPSFELFGRHPETDELIEIGNSGIFRPEMLEPLGVEADVMAWGLALERLFMLATGAEDIRDVHGTLVDLEFLRNEEVVY
ncbi:phenylalanine--tRNA ligase subunit alpha [Halosimplex rubrum]|uniref:Phenylalanine--tRNA ligase alpha subunit n=1 Tax=Halosimplex rubrum TaxID=869889 RepID=A0A7D5NYQ7_9EURY|nr:phenylalanine--tRNA ligase subunit alpha [Halosimplex rubrum]QLH76626.1 phenylalanine--tRNA ligase subunit alpha [Halosimplex rubrum]